MQYKDKSKISRWNVRDQINPSIFGKHKGSWEGIIEPHFLDKIDIQAQRSLNKLQSRSLGRKEKTESKVKILEPQYETNLRDQESANKWNKHNPIQDLNVKYKVIPKSSRISETDLSKFANMYVTVDSLSKNPLGLRYLSHKKTDNHPELNKVCNSKIQSTVFPQINKKISEEQPLLAGCSLYDSKSISKQNLKLFYYSHLKIINFIIWDNMFIF